MRPGEAFLLANDFIPVENLILLLLKCLLFRKMDADKFDARI